MSTIFTRIITGEIPGRFIWSDDACVAFLTIEPLAAGHTLVVPRAEVDQWVDLNSEDTAHLFSVAQSVGRAIRHVYEPARIGMMIQGFEVPHTHIHLWPANSPADFNLAAVDHSPTSESLDEAAASLRMALRDLGHGEFVPPRVSSAQMD